MKIRSITYFFNPGWPLEERALNLAGEFITAARPAFEAAGYEVQTARLATPPFPELLLSGGLSGLARLGKALEESARELNYEYVSLGPALPHILESYEWIPDLIAATEDVFAAGMMTTPQGEVSLSAVRACARIIHAAAALSADGFANLRFAALANVSPGSPFFPAAYHRGGAPAFALASEAADLAVEAFKDAGSLAEGRQRLVESIEGHARPLSEVARQLEGKFQVAFGGIDFTPAPFPVEALSFGAAMESLGVQTVGSHGSLAAAAILADTLDRASFPRAGFNGLMLPVLEDAILARRAAEGWLSLQDLLLYSAVCGTGLDTIPLPGETSVEQLNAVLLDVAALSLRLDKPLTARLMPIPGAQAGDPTEFDFAYFANSRVLAVEAAPLHGPLAGKSSFPLGSRLA
jgi:uncharacterized protein (UPF0210 family)